ncbi:MAG: hypothetical protein KKA52_06360 [Candidatus Omnitrophica bacterium]|nr:hypothetical protein [Candidatus Omnitrophota bacterium]
MRNFIKKQLKAVAVIIIYQLILLDAAQAVPLNATIPQPEQNLSTLSPRLLLSPKLFFKAYQNFSDLPKNTSELITHQARQLHEQFKITKQNALFLARIISKYGYPNIFLQTILGKELSYEAFRKSLTVPKIQALPYIVQAQKLLEKFAVREQSMRFLIEAIEEYGHENVRGALEIIRENRRENRWLFYAPQILETLSIAIQQLGKENVMRPLTLKNISAPVPGDFEIMPATTLPLVFGEDMYSQYLVFFPQDLDNSLKFRNGKSRKDRDGVDHVPGALAFIQFNILHNKLVVTSIQSDVYSSLSKNHKKKFKAWPEMMIEVLKAFTRDNQNISRIIIPDASIQFERFKKHGFPESIAQRIYEEAPANCGFIKLKGVNPPIEVEDFSMDSFWVIDLPIDTNRLPKLPLPSAIENKFVQEAI